MSDTTHEAPERIWITGDASKGSWNSRKANFEGPTETEYVRADRIEELEDRVANMAGLWAKSDSEKQLLLGRIEELEAKLAKVKTSFRRNMIQAYPNYTYKHFAKDFDEMLKGDKT